MAMRTNRTDENYRAIFDREPPQYDFDENFFPRVRRNDGSRDTLEEAKLYFAGKEARRIVMDLSQHNNAFRVSPPEKSHPWFSTDSLGSIDIAGVDQIDFEKLERFLQLRGHELPAFVGMEGRNVAQQQLAATFRNFENVANMIEDPFLPTIQIESTKGIKSLEDLLAKAFKNEIEFKELCITPNGFAQPILEGQDVEKGSVCFAKDEYFDFYTSKDDPKILAKALQNFYQFGIRHDMLDDDPLIDKKLLIQHARQSGDPDRVKKIAFNEIVTNVKHFENIKKLKQNIETRFTQVLDKKPQEGEVIGPFEIPSDLELTPGLIKAVKVVKDEMDRPPIESEPWLQKILNVEDEQGKLVPNKPMIEQYQLLKKQGKSSFDIFLELQLLEDQRKLNEKADKARATLESKMSGVELEVSKKVREARESIARDKRLDEIKQNYPEKMSAKAKQSAAKKAPALENEDLDELAELFKQEFGED